MIKLLPCKARCKFSQYIVNEPHKFGLKFWLAVDIQMKYLFNGFLFAGKNKTRNPNVSVPTDVALKMIAPLFQRWYSVTITFSLQLILPESERTPKQMQGQKTVA